MYKGKELAVQVCDEVQGVAVSHCTSVTPALAIRLSPEASVCRSYSRSGATTASRPSSTRALMQLAYGQEQG